MIYRGRSGMWSWILHRITGVGVMVFLFLHILDTFPVLIGAPAYNTILRLYRNPIFELGEVVLVAALLLHAVNGVRVILVDLLPRGSRLGGSDGKLFPIVIAVFLILIIPTAIIMLWGIWRAKG